MSILISPVFDVVLVELNDRRPSMVAGSTGRDLDERLSGDSIPPLWIDR